MADKKFTRKEIEERNQPTDAAIIIDNLVYEVTPFLDEHPGGREILIDNAGKDATECFRDVGHSDDAHQWRKQFLIGQVVEEERWQYRHREPTATQGGDALTLGGLVHACGPPALVLALASLLYLYLF